MKRATILKFTMLLLIIFSLSQKAAKSQTPAASIDNINAVGFQYNQVFNVPVRVQDIYNLGSLGLWIWFNSSVLTYDGVNSINPLISNNFTYNYDGTYLRIGWFNMGSAGVNLGSAVLFNIQFKYKVGSSAINFYLPKCSFGDFTTLKPINVTYSNGQVLNIPTAFSLLFPANNASVYPTPEFQWNASSGAAYYKLFLDGQLFHDNITSNSYQVQSNEFLVRGIHTWHVVAVNSLGNIQSTETWNINVRSAPKGLVLVSPQNGAYSGPCDVEFVWNAFVDFENGVAAYELHVDGFDSIHLSPEDTSIVFPYSLPYGNTNWYVVAIGNDQNTQNSATYSLNVIEQFIYSLDGTVKYCNSYNTPLQGVTVELKDLSDSLIASTVTDNDGYFLFSNLTNGSYKLVASSNNAVGSIDPLDALLINKYYVKLFQMSDPLKLKAADVNADNYIKPNDALAVNRFYTRLKLFFEAGDWFFDNPLVNISCNNNTVNFKGICFGDFNGSFRP